MCDVLKLSLWHAGCEEHGGKIHPFRPFPDCFSYSLFQMGIFASHFRVSDENPSFSSLVKAVFVFAEKIQSPPSGQVCSFRKKVHPNTFKDLKKNGSNFYFKRSTWENSLKWDFSFILDTIWGLKPSDGEICRSGAVKGLSLWLDGSWLAWGRFRCSSGVQSGFFLPFDSVRACLRSSPA